MGDTSECVQVVIRCRPLNSTEKGNKNYRIIEMDIKNGVVSVNNPSSPDDPPKTWTFDSVYNWDTVQANMFEGTARAIVDNVIEGYNGTIFAYGQTGTGKSFSMEGGKTEELKGVIPRSFDQIFEHIQATDGTEFLIQASFIEIYNEDVFDLIAPVRQKLDLKEDPDRGVYVKDVQWMVMKDKASCDEMLKQGNTNRVVGATKMNADSSRSHSIFTLKIETSQMGADGEPHIKAGKLNMVDLAGSERQGKTGAEGDRLKEATKINLSLSALGNVISSLTSAKKSKHIPYRDSKLTRLLQDSLGGNTKTVMIAAIGPADYNYDETLSTLRFANRAKSIKNKPKINEDPKDAQLREFQEEIQRLKMMLAQDGDIDWDNLDEATLQAFGMGAGGPGGVIKKKLPPQKVVVEKVVKKVVTKGVTMEMLKEEEEKAAENRKKMEEEFEKEKNDILAATRELEEKAQAAEEALGQTSEIAEKKKQERKELKKKLKEMEDQLLMGKDIMSNAQKQKLLIKKKEAELRRKKIEAERIKQEVQEREEIQLQLAEKYESQDKELTAKNKKFEKLKEKYTLIKSEIEGVQAETGRERDELLETIRELTRHIQLKDLIIEHFVPEAVNIKMEQRAFWDEEREEWLLQEIDFQAENNNVSRPGSGKPNQFRPISEFARIKAALGDTNPRFKADNIIQLELDMPERTTQDFTDLQYQLQGAEMSDPYAEMSPNNYDQYAGQQMYDDQQHIMHDRMMQQQNMQMGNVQMDGYGYGMYADQAPRDFNPYEDQMKQRGGRMY